MVRTTAAVSDLDGGDSADAIAVELADRFRKMEITALFGIAGLVIAGFTYRRFR